VTNVQIEPAPYGNQAACGISHCAAGAISAISNCSCVAMF